MSEPVYLGKQCGKIDSQGFYIECPYQTDDFNENKHNFTKDETGCTLYGNLIFRYQRCSECIRLNEEGKDGK
jgi:hypothetical protein